MPLPLPEFDDTDAIGQAEWVRRGEVSPAELLEAALARVEARNPQLNAVVMGFALRAREQLAALPEDAPLRGVPFLLKDLLTELEATPLTMACRLRRGHVATESSALSLRYERAGLVIIGRTNTPELGLLGVTEPALWGPCRNPWDPTRSPGGSSGGAAAAVASRMVAAAQGGDGGGSIRIPAAHCGLVGLKPTRGRVSLGPLRMEAWAGFVQEHALTRTVRDCALLLDIAEGPGVGEPLRAPPKARPFLDEVGRDPGRLRVAYTFDTLLGGELNPDCRRATEEALRLLEDLGHELVETGPRFSPAAMREAYFTVVTTQTALAVEELSREAGRAPRAADFEPATWFLAQVGWGARAHTYARALAEIQATTLGMAEFFEERFDLFLTATTAQPAPAIGQFDIGALETLGLWFARWLPLPHALLRGALLALADEQLAPVPNTQLFNMTGHPAVSLPMGHDGRGVPLGVQLVARHGGEDLLLRVAAQIEQARPWGALKPSMCL